MDDARRIRADANEDAPTVIADDAFTPTMGFRSPDRCRVESSDVFLLGTDNDLSVRSRPIGVGPNASSFGVVWREVTEGLPQVRFTEIPATSGPAPAARTVTEGTATHEEPSIVASGGGYVVAWTDNSADDFEIHARTVSGMTLGAIQRITNRMGRDDAPTLIGVGSDVLAGWVEERGTSRVPVVRPLSATAAPTGTAHDVTVTGNIGRPILAPREGGAVIAYSDTVAGLPDVFLQRVDASGASVGAREMLSGEHNATGDIDVGLTALDGAAVFGANLDGRRDVRIRRLDGTGTPSVAEYAANRDAEFGDSASVARLREAVGWSRDCRDGYAIIYRSYPGAGAAPVLRLLLIDAGAQVVRVVDLNIPDISAQGGRTTLRISGDGQLLVAWTDAHADRVDMRAARIRCD
jgi:hypothetical protein